MSGPDAVGSAGTGYKIKDFTASGPLSGTVNGAVISREGEKKFDEAIGHVDVKVIFLQIEDGWQFPIEEVKLNWETGILTLIKLECNRKNNQYLDWFNSGRYKPILRRFFAGVKAAGVPVLIHPIGHEMNGRSFMELDDRPSHYYWYPWGDAGDFGPTSVNGPKKYKTAYNDFLVIANEEKVENAFYAWNPHVQRFNIEQQRFEEADFFQYYPPTEPGYPADGANKINIILFDSYCPLGEQDCSGVGDWLARDIVKIDTEIDNWNQKNKAEPKKQLRKLPYGVGEAGAKLDRQLPSILSVFDGTHPVLKAKGIKPLLSIYYNVPKDAVYATHITPLKGGLIPPFQKYLASLNNDQFDFRPDKLADNPNLAPYPLPAPPTPLPNPDAINRDIPPSAFVLPSQIAQQVCPPPQSAENCLSTYPDELDLPPYAPPYGAAVDPNELSVKELKLDRSVGDIFDRRVHLRKLNEKKLALRLTRGDLPLETVEKLLEAVARFQGKPLSPLPHALVTTKAVNWDMLRDLEKISAVFTGVNNPGKPDLYEPGYLDQPSTFWDNLLILHRVYTQKAIEENNQEKIKKSIGIGQRLQEQIIDQKKTEDRYFASPQTPSRVYEYPRLLLSIAEGYSLLREASSDKYKTGLALAEEALKLLNPRGSSSNREYYALINGMIIAADLHARIAQQFIKEKNYDASRDHYLASQKLFQAIASLNLKDGRGLEVRPFKIGAAASNIEVIAGVAEIKKSLRHSLQAGHITDEEMNAGSHEIFRVLKGKDLLRLAGLALENPYKPFNEAGYPDLCQVLAYLDAGLDEIKKGSPYGDNRYFLARADHLIALALKMLADSLILSTSQKKDEAESRKVYQAALALLQKAAPGLLPEKFNKDVAGKLAQNYAYNSVMAAYDLYQLVYSKENVRGLMLSLSDVISTTSLRTTRELIKQANTTSNFRLDIAKALTELAGSYLDQGMQVLRQPNRLIKRDDKFEERAVDLRAGIVLQQADNELRLSTFRRLNNPFMRTFKFNTPDEPLLEGNFYKFSVRPDFTLPYRPESTTTGAYNLMGLVGLRKDEAAIESHGKENDEDYWWRAVLNKPISFQINKSDVSVARAGGGWQVTVTRQVPLGQCKNKDEDGERCYDQKDIYNIDFPRVQRLIDNIEGAVNNKEISPTAYLKIEAALLLADLYLIHSKNDPAKVMKELQQAADVLTPGIRQMIELQPERSRFLLAAKFDLKLAMAYSVMAAEYQKQSAYGQRDAILKKAEILLDNEDAKAPGVRQRLEQAAAAAKEKKEPPLFDLHDLLASTYHQLAIVKAVSLKDSEEKYLNLAYMSLYAQFAYSENLSAGTQQAVDRARELLFAFVPRPHKPKRKPGGSL
jgi:hypothetical protein